MKRQYTELENKIMEEFKEIINTTNGTLDRMININKVVNELQSDVSSIDQIILEKSDIVDHEISEFGKNSDCLEKDIGNYMNEMTQLVSDHSSQLINIGKGLNYLAECAVFYVNIPQFYIGMTDIMQLISTLSRCIMGFHAPLTQICEFHLDFVDGRSITDLLKTYSKYDANPHEIIDKAMMVAKENIHQIDEAFESLHKAFGPKWIVSCVPMN